jgi:hypothetical protein
LIENNFLCLLLLLKNCWKYFQKHQNYILPYKCFISQMLVNILACNCFFQSDFLHATFQKSSLTGKGDLCLVWISILTRLICNICCPTLILWIFLCWHRTRCSFWLLLITIIRWYIFDSEGWRRRWGLIGIDLELPMAEGTTCTLPSNTLD